MKAVLAGFGAPVVQFDTDYKYCLETCNACTQVCPTGALAALDLDAKNKYVIGEALVDNNVCLTALGKKECDACEHACPVRRGQNHLGRAAVQRLPRGQRQVHRLRSLRSRLPHQPGQSHSRVDPEACVIPPRVST